MAVSFDLACKKFFRKKSSGGGRVGRQGPERSRKVISLDVVIVCEKWRSGSVKNKDLVNKTRNQRL